MKKFSFRLLNQDKRTKARTGLLETAHGVIQTPAFVPVGTQATVKSLSPEELQTLGVQIFFVNTYHAYLRPGTDIIKKFGGLHKFMHWNGPVITDSGGFQVFSLARASKYKAKNAEEGMIIPAAKISENGVEFQSHWDGSRHTFTPELSMDYQWMLGSDIHIAFDDCTPYPVTEAKARASMERTHRWAKRSLDAHKKHKGDQALYGVVQGSVYKDLREESAKVISSMDFDGIAIGGVSVGETKKEMVRVLDWVIPHLPDEKPRHLLGVGEIDDIFALVERGVDTFDCVQPTRLARMGRLLTRKTDIDITKKIYEKDMMPIDDGCTCYSCTNFSRAYVHHLFRVRELLAYRLATIHNLHFVHRLVDDIREAILKDQFLELKKQWI